MVNSTQTKLSGHAKDETGKRYGKLTVVEFSHVKLEVYWLCQCDCGRSLTVRGSHLRVGGVTTCGCVHYKANGHSGSPIYQAWQAMKDRCCNPNNKAFANYGGRGITVCDRWLESFLNFFEDMGDRPFEGATLDRIDNESGYSKDNCRWATRHEQMANTRTAKLLTYNGETKCQSEWARELGVDPKTLTYRLKQGWTLEKALTSQATHPKNCRTRMLTYNGKTLCIADWARELGINHATLSERLATWAVEKALSTPGRKFQKLTHDGETLGIGEWARKLAIPHRTLARRITDQGWSIAQVIEYYK